MFAARAVPVPAYCSCRSVALKKLTRLDLSKDSLTVIKWQTLFSFKENSVNRFMVQKLTAQVKTRETIRHPLMRIMVELPNMY